MDVENYTGIRKTKMAFFWEDKIGDVVYSNPELDTVKILWRDDKGVYREHYLAVDEEDEQFQALLKVTTYEEIEGRTKAFNETIRQEFKDAFIDYAERQGWYMTPPEPGPQDLTVAPPPEEKFDPFNHYGEFFRFFIDYDINDPEDKERLFSLKLNIFEKDEVKNSDTSERSKNAKTTVRKALKPIQAIAALELFNNENAEIRKDDEGNITGVFVPFT